MSKVCEILGSQNLELNF